MSKEHYLAGDDSWTRQFTIRNSEKGSIDNGDVLFAGKMGKLCEEHVMNIWSGKVVPNNEARSGLGVLFYKISQQNAGKFISTIHREQAVDIFNNLAAPEDSESADWSQEITPANADFGQLVKQVDQILVCDLWHEYQTIAGAYRVENNKIRYWAQTVLVLAKELVKPTFTENEPKSGSVSVGTVWLGGKLIPNVYVPRGQFDAIVLPKREFKKQNGSSFDLTKYWSTNDPWALIEVKIPYRPRYISGPQKIKKPFSWDEDQMLHKLGGCLIDWNETNNDRGLRPVDDPEYHPFPWPKKIIYCYLRGLAAPAIHVTSVDRRFLENWQLRVNIAIGNINSLEDIGDDERGELGDLLTIGEYLSNEIKIAKKHQVLHVKSSKSQDGAVQDKLF